MVDSAFYTLICEANNAEPLSEAKAEKRLAEKLNKFLYKFKFGEVIKLRTKSS
jgi:hypothetical protein